MKRYFQRIVVLSVLFALGVNVSFADAQDIRYRSIIYFYPEVKSVDIDLAKKAFEGFTPVAEFQATSTKPIVRFELVSDVKTSYPVPDMNFLSYFGRGIDKQQAERIQKSALALLIDVAYPEDMVLDGLKASSASVYRYAESVDGLIWDSETRELFSPLAWKDKRIDRWTEAIPVISDHTVIHAYNNGEGVRAITLGMIKFGLPDVVVNNFSWSLSRSMGNLINLTTQLLGEGVRPDKDGMLALNVKQLVNNHYREGLVASLKDNALPEVSLLTGKGQWEEGDPENAILELLFDHVEGSSLSEKHDALVSNLFGWEDEITYVKHNEMILEASERAKEKLSGLRDDFNKGLNPGEFIQLKAPFDTTDGGKEWMWVEVLSWDSEKINGLLKNEPYNVPTLKAGSEVVINQRDVFDYIRRFADGSSEGNETGELIQKYRN